MIDSSGVLLEVIAHGVTAILALWLGLTAIVHSGRRPAGRVFGFLCLLLIAWSTAIIIERTTSDAGVALNLNAVEDLAACLLPAATLHVALAIGMEGRYSPTQRGVLIAGYLLGLLMSVPAIFDPALEVRVTPPHLELPPVDGAILGWAWIATRVAIFALALFWILASLRQHATDEIRRRQLLVAAATISVGAVGGSLRFLPGPADTDPWIGVSLVAAAMVIAVYAVFAQGLFLSPNVAERAFQRAVLVGVGVTALVGVLVFAEQLTRRLLGIQLPIVTALALVATMALFDPVAARVREVFAGDRPSYDRLLRALGESMLTGQRPHEAIEPALVRLCHTFEISAAQVVAPDGTRLASHGTANSAGDGLVIQLIAGETELGNVRFGAKVSGLAYTPREIDLLHSAATYISSSLRLAQREAHQAAALDRLSEERRAVATAGSALASALVESGSAVIEPPRLHVFALGPMRVQRGTELIRQWGGDKAGTHQAEALFAFLFDRGERGMVKDDAIELIWPDVDIERADLAFHRTLGGLRRTLEPNRRSRQESVAITFYNDRYRLHPEFVEWSDVAAFSALIAEAGAATTPDGALRALESARGLYRGDYLDDCPFFGDSAQVEERRELLRGRYIDVLLALGDRYERRGDRPAAADAFREARLASADELPLAEAALARLNAGA